MGIIAVLSIFALALIIKFLFLLRRKNITDKEWEENILKEASAKNIQEILNLCKENSPLFGKVIFEGLKGGEVKIEKLEEILEREGRALISYLQNNLRYLADIGTIAPMLGLLGTVLGMIQAFQVVAFQTGLAKPVMLAAGISKALITTAAGLIVGIPSMAFYFFFRGRLGVLIREGERIGESLVERLKGGNS